jgi:hypothetical protein
MTARPHEKDEALPAAAEPLTEEEWDRLLPPIDESDSEWQAYVRKKIRKSLDDPRPSVPAKEAFARVDARIAEYKAKRGI